MKFGTFFFDYDLDGRLDLLVCNGHLEPEISKVQSDQRYAQPPQLYWNTGDQQRLFELVPTEQSGKSSSSNRSSAAAARISITTATASSMSF